MQPQATPAPKNDTSFAWIWRPVLVSLLVFSLGDLLAYHTQKQNKSELLAILTAANGGQAALVEFDLLQRISTVAQFARQWQDHGGFSQAEFKAGAQDIIDSQPGFEALVLMGENNQVRWYVPGPGNHAASGLTQALEENSQMALAAARQTNLPSMTISSSLMPGVRGYMVAFPIYARGNWAGSVLAVFQFDGWLNKVIGTSTLAAQPEFVTAVSMDDVLVFAKPGWQAQTAQPGALSKVQVSTTLNVLGHRFEVQSQVSDSFLAFAASDEPAMILLVSFLVSSLVGLVWVWVEHLRREKLGIEIYKLYQLKEELRVTQLSLDLTSRVDEIGSWSWDLRSNSMFWSERMYTLFDVDAGAALDYKVWEHTLHPEDRQSATSMVELVLEGRAVYNIEYRVVTRSNETRIIAEMGVLEKDGADLPVRMNGISWDITGRRLTETDLSRLVKEQNCLKEVSRLAENLDLNEDDFYQRVFGIVITALDFPQLAAAAVELEGKCFQTANYYSAGLTNKLLATLKIKGRSYGELALYYPTGQPFKLPEDQSLLEGIADVLSIRSEREKSENQIRTLAQAVDQSPVSIVITDVGGRIEYVNSQFCTLTGYKQAEVIGKNPRLLQSGYTSAREYKELWKTISAGKIWKGEFRNRKENGEFYWESASIGPIMDAKGNITHYLAVKENISALKELDADRNALIAALAAEKRRVLDILESTNAGTWEWNIQTGASSFNDHWARICGYKLSEIPSVVAEPLREFLHPDDFPMAAALLQMYLTNELDYFEIEARTCQKDGSLVWVNLKGKVVSWDERGSPIMFAATIVDISKRKIAELDLRKSEAQQRALLEAVPDLVLHLRKDGVILGCKANLDSKAFAGLDQIVGSSIDQILDEPASHKVKDCLVHASQRGIVPVTEFSLKTGDATFTYEARFKSTGSGEILAIVRDISERSRLELMKSDFINRATHELRTPIATMLLMINLIENHQSRAEFDEFWGVLKGEINRERLLVEQLLKAGQLESDQVQYKFRSMRVENLIQHAVRHFEYQAMEKDIRFSVESMFEDDPSAHLVRADETELIQVFQNLIENAIKYTPAGGNVSITIGSSDDRIRISFADTGIGIPSEDIPLLFNRFFRGTNAVEQEIQGTGIGLFIVRSIMEKHGGMVQVSSELGMGSKFDVWLPEVRL